ncbi:hypothetical protein [Deinococcus misasensis]|uniref:hypothetical protein n=1 Tax=Deinococcus misasensis TaxID=392413 RepID=UPI0014704275|nr:hypothetical protein [Deinococcus misasensis]
MQMEERRLEATRRLEDPHPVQKDLAHDLGVHPNTISLWKQRFILVANASVPDSLIEA